MGNERRLLILCHLSQGEKSVGELEELVRLSQSALSQHLARLRRDKLVRTRRSAQTIYYRLDGDDTRSVLAILADLYVVSDALVPDRRPPKNPPSKESPVAADISGDS
jgi:DNA-binding transcriptional ArsR family regulator